MTEKHEGPLPACWLVNVSERQMLLQLFFWGGEWGVVGSSQQIFGWPAFLIALHFSKLVTVASIKVANFS